MLKVDQSVATGTRAIFTQYLDQDNMAPEDLLFSAGQHVVVASVNEDGGMICFPTDHMGNIISHEGDTLFPEEMVLLSYCPKLAVSIPV